jgi:hypothetical protein
LTTIPERWRPIPGYEGVYSVIRHAHKHGMCTRTIRERVLRPNYNGEVRLSMAGEAVRVRVNRLYAEAFDEAARS